MKIYVKALATAVMTIGCIGRVMSYAPDVVPDLKFYVSGGPEHATDFLEFAQSLMLQDGNLDVYSDDTANCGVVFTNLAVYGTWRTTSAGISAGKKVYIAYTNIGGSFVSAVDALVRAHGLNYQTFLNNASHAGACASTLGKGLLSPFTGWAQYVETDFNQTESHVPDVSLTEEEIPLFTGVNLPRTAPNQPVTQQELSGVVRTPLYEKAYGIAINNVLASAMMTAFGNRNVSSAQVTAILAGTYTDWSQICQINASGASTCLPAGPITFISRAPGSGMKAAFNEYFLNNPGTTGFAGTSVPPVDQTGNQGDCTNFSNVSYNVCDYGLTVFVKRALNIANSKGTRAIGMVELETEPIAPDSFTFANLDGVEIARTTSKTCGSQPPFLAYEPARVVNGDHRLYFTNWLNVRGRSVGGAHFVGDGSYNSAFMSAFATAAANPYSEISIPGVLLDPWVVSGPGGFQYDACITKGSHNTDSTGPIVNLF